MSEDTALHDLALADQRQTEAAHLAGEVVAYWQRLVEGKMPETLIASLVLQYNVLMLQAEFGEDANTTC